MWKLWPITQWSVICAQPVRTVLRVTGKCWRDVSAAIDEFLLGFVREVYVSCPEPISSLPHTHFGCRFFIKTKEENKTRQDGESNARLELLRSSVWELRPVLLCVVGPWRKIIFVLVLVSPRNVIVDILRESTCTNLGDRGWWADNQRMACSRMRKGL